MKQARPHRERNGGGIYEVAPSLVSTIILGMSMGLRTNVPLDISISPGSGQLTHPAEGNW